MKNLLDILIEKNQQIDCLAAHNSVTPFDAVVYAGCGLIENLSKWQKLAPFLYFIEADDAVAEMNHEAIEKVSGARYYHAMLWTHETAVVYREHNFSRFNGLKKWVDTQQRFPNVRETAQRTLTSIGLRQLGLPEAANQIVLILDLNGAECQWLQLSENELPDAVCQIWVVLAPNFCFENASQIESLIQWSQVHFWSLSIVENIRDFGQVLCFLRNDFARHLLDDQVKEIHRLQTEHEKKISVLLLQNQKDVEAREFSWFQREQEKLDEQKQIFKNELDELLAQQQLLKKENQQLHETIEKLKSERQIIGQRQAALNHELLKGQAQIELIKDLLLKGDHL